MCDKARPRHCRDPSSRGRPPARRIVEGFERVRGVRRRLGTDRRREDGHVEGVLEQFGHPSSAGPSTRRIVDHRLRGRENRRRLRGRRRLGLPRRAPPRGAGVGHRKPTIRMHESSPNPRSRLDFGHNDVDVHRQHHRSRGPAAGGLPGHRDRDVRGPAGPTRRLHRGADPGGREDARRSTDRPTRSWSRNRSRWLEQVEFARAGHPGGRGLVAADGTPRASRRLPDPSWCRSPAADREALDDGRSRR